MEDRHALDCSSWFKCVGHKFVKNPSGRPEAHKAVSKRSHFSVVYLSSFGAGSRSMSRLRSQAKLFFSDRLIPLAVQSVSPTLNGDPRRFGLDADRRDKVYAHFFS